MPLESPGVDDPRRWMDFARADLQLAEKGAQKGFRLEPLCFHAQQAAEKALKAVLIRCRVPFPKIHDLGRLMDLLPPDLTPSPAVRAACEISGYSEAGRYPHGFEDVTREDLKHAVRHAKTVFEWADKVLDGIPGVGEPPAVYRVPGKRRAAVRGRKCKTGRARPAKRGRSSS